MISMKLLIAILILATVLIAGCVTEPRETPPQYICPNSSIVSDPSLCYETVKTTKNETAAVLIDYVPNESALKQSEKAIFDIVNEIRTENGIKKFLWNDAIANLARAKSKDMADRNYFNHVNPEGETFKDILNKNKIFYLVASEDIEMIGNITSDQILLNLSEYVVEGWLNSPAHRVPILDKDEIYSDAGVGTYCKNNTCYFTMEFAEIETKTNWTMHNNYGIFHYIYDPTLPFDYNVSALIEVNSTKLTDTYIVEDKSLYSNFMSGYPITSTVRFLHNSSISTVVKASKGYGVIIFSNPDWVFSDANITLKIRYLKTL